MYRNHLGLKVAGTSYMTKCQTASLFEFGCRIQTFNLNCASVCLIEIGKILILMTSTILSGRPGN